jgi:PucR-like helix-turn-helix protein
MEQPPNFPARALERGTTPGIGCDAEDAMSPTPTSKAGATANVLVDALIADGPAIVAKLREAVRRELPTYGEVPAEALDLDFHVEFEQILRAARSGRAPEGDADLAGLAVAGERRALQGVPLDEMLRAWGIAVAVLVEHAREVGERLAMSAEQMLDFVAVARAWADLAMVATARGHRRAELELARRDQDHRARLVRGALLGTIAPGEARAHAQAYGLDPDAEYVAIRARPAEGVPHHRLERALGFHDTHRRGLSALVEGDLSGFLVAPPTGDPPGVVGIGPARPLDLLADSFRLASRALVTADRLGLDGAHPFDRMGLRPAIVADTDVGCALWQRYLAPLEAAGSSSQMIDTLRAWFACEMHVERAAERLVVHPNTLRYRIARFEKLTGANLRDPAIAFETWWALQGAEREPPCR